MTDDLLISFRSDVPLPDEAAAQRIHARATSGRQPRRRQPLMLGVAAAAICAVAAAVVFSGILISSNRPASEPLPFAPLDLAFTRDANGELTSLDATVRAATRGGTAQIRVVRGLVDAPEDASPSQVVFQEKVAMTDVPSPPSGPPGTVVLSTWTGSLPTSDWNGGCQHGPYVMTVRVSPEPSNQIQAESVESGSFACSSG